MQNLNTDLFKTSNRSPDFIRHQPRRNLPQFTFAFQYWITQQEVVHTKFIKEEEEEAHC